MCVLKITSSDYARDALKIKDVENLLRVDQRNNIEYRSLANIRTSEIHKQRSVRINLQ